MKYIVIHMPGGVSGKRTCCLPIRDVAWIFGSGRSPGGGYGSPLQYSCLENPMSRGAWLTAVHGVTKESDTAEQRNNNQSQGPWTSFKFSWKCQNLRSNEQVITPSPFKTEIEFLTSSHNYYPTFFFVQTTSARKAWFLSALGADTMALKLPL